MNKDTLILQHIPMTEKLITKFQIIYPGHKDEINSSAHYGLCVAVKAICDGVMATDKYTTYIYAVVRDHIIKGVTEHDHLLPVTRWAYAKGTRRLNKDNNVSLEQTLEHNDDSSRLEVEEFLETLTDEERLVLQLRTENWTMDEIAIKVGYKRACSIFRLLERIAEKARKELFDGRAGFARKASKSD